MLFHNKIGPGQKISYRDLAEQLKMSQTPVIQALKWLEFQNIVIHKPHRGYYTAQVSAKEVAEIYELRELIETTLLAKTMARIEPEDIRRLKQAFSEHTKTAKEMYLYRRLIKDMEFHLTLAALSENEIQQQVLKNLYDLLYLKYGINILLTTSMDMKAGYSDHEKLVEQIENRDLESARRTLVNHISRVKKHVLFSLKETHREKDEYPE